MTSRPITTTATQLLRPLLLGLLLVLVFAPLGVAGDPDDDWGLPAMPASEQHGGGAQGAGGGSSAGSSTAQSAGVDTMPELPVLGVPVATHLEGALSSSEGQLLISVDSAAPVGAGQASVTPLGGDAEPKTVPSFSGAGNAVALQGAASIQLASNLSMTLRAPEFVGLHSAFLLIDDGEVGTLSELIHTAGGRAHITGFHALGALSALDVTRLQQLVDGQADLLGEQRVSVVIVSLELPLVLSSGAHVSGVRMAPEASQVELLTD